MSQRETYQFPSTSGGGGSGGAGSGYDSTTLAAPKVQYVCGDCNYKVSLDKEEKIRCTHCGHRVLYKERTKRMVQFEAR